MTIPHRRQPPPRRASRIIGFVHDGVKFYGSIGWFDRPGESLAEVFLTGGKPDSAADSAAMDGAILASLLLQMGVPAAELRKRLGRREDGKGGGPIAALLELAREDSR